MNAQAPCILVADADRTAASLVHAGLVGSGYRIVVVHDGEVALRLIQDERPALAVLATQLPSRGGLDIVRIVRADARFASLPIILLGTRTDASDRIHGLELGADDFIAKPFHPREVAARVKALLRRQAIDTAPQPSTMRRAGDITIDPDEHEAHLGGAPLPLTPTEFRLLQVLMGQPGRAYSRPELIEQGLGPRFNGKERTLDSHMRNLRAKIEHGPHHKHYVKTVFGVGYRLVVPQDGAGRPAVDSVVEPLADHAGDDTAGH